MGNVFALLLPFLLAELPEGQRYGHFGPVSIRLSTGEPTNLYLESEFTAIYRESTIKVRFENTGAEAVSLTCRGELLDYTGNKRALRPVRSTVAVNPHEVKKVLFASDAHRGVYAFLLRVTGEGQLSGLPEREFLRVFGVVPDPAEGLRPDTFFRIEETEVWRPYTGELCRRMGVKAARVMLEPDVKQELFNSWMAAARSRGLNLMALCSSQDLTALPTAFSTTLGNSATAYDQQVRWGTCGFRLEPGEVRPEVLELASRRVLDHYSLEGSADQVCLVVDRAEPSVLEKLDEIGVVFGRTIAVQPEPGPYFLRQLDRVATLGRRHGKPVSLGGFCPSGETMSEAASILAGYTLASLAGMQAVSSRGPEGLLDRAGRQRVVLAQVHGTLAHFLRERAPVAEVWPRQTLLFGCVFARPDLRPEGIERSTILAARDNALGIHATTDDLKIAVLFSAAERMGDSGELFVGDSADLGAYNLAGNPTGLRRGEGLSVPFGREPVYVTTRDLTVSQFVTRLRRAEIHGLRLFHYAPQPFTQPGLSFPALRVLVGNSDTRLLTGTLSVSGLGGSAKRLRFNLEPGEVKQVRLELTRSMRRPDGVYSLTLTAVTRFGEEKRRVAVPSAIVWPISANVDGRLSEWEKFVGLRWPGETGAVRDDTTGQRGSSSGLSEPVVWAGYDRDWFYIAVSVAEDEVRTPWDGGASPASLQAALSGSAVQVAFGFGDRSDDAPRTPEDPWCWKGMIRDTDYLYLLAPGAEGQAHVACLHQPSMVWGESLLRGAATVPEGRCAVGRDGAKTIYEAAIPRSQLKAFDETELRLGVVIHSNGRTRQLARCCGIFQYLASGGSFLPSENSALLPNQVWWGVAP